MIDLGISGFTDSELRPFGLEAVLPQKRLSVDDSTRSAQSLIAQKRKSVDIVLAKTSSRKQLMTYLSDTRLDVVFPDVSKIKIDASIANMARDNEIAIGFSFADVRNSCFKLRRIAKCAELLERKGCMVILSTGATNPEYLRDLESIAALFRQLGFSSVFLDNAITGVPQKILTRNQERGVMPGVRLV